MLAVVRASSVRSGRTSLTAPTSVVLPAPNPPATTILNASSSPPAWSSEGAEPMQHLLEQVSAGLPRRGLPRHDGDPAAPDEVGKQDPDHAQRQRGDGGHVGHGNRPAAQAEDPAVFGTEIDRVAVPRAGFGGG